MDPGYRLPTIRRLLGAALDSDATYAYEGEMSEYTRSYAADAATDLDTLFRFNPPSEAEAACCAEALADPGRIARGRSARLLLRLEERARPLLDALARSPDPRARAFALEAGALSTPGAGAYRPLYGSADLAEQLLGDADEGVRLAAVAVAGHALGHEAERLQRALDADEAAPPVRLLHRLLALLNDPSPRIRSGAAVALRGRAAHAGRDALAALLAEEGDPEARAALTAALASCDPAGDDGGGPGYPDDYPGEFKG